MTGRQFARVLRALPPEELDAEIAELVDRYDRATCHDCGRHHDSVRVPWPPPAMASARRRRDSARLARAIARGRAVDEPEPEPEPEAAVAS